MHPRERIEYRTAALKAAQQWRDAAAPAVAPGELDVRSNDYLGLAGNVSRETESANRAGAGASRLISGTWPEHVVLERALAEWLGTEAALVFSSGYAANLGALSALAGPGETIFSDALNHASIIDGCRLSRADVIVVPHGDAGALEKALRAEHRVKWVVTETYFSMDADSPDLRRIRALCDQHQAALIVDEAHALGVFGPGGRGLCAQQGVVPDVLVGAFGKAFGLQGGFVAGPKSYCDWLWNRARSFVYSTGVSPAQCRLTVERLDMVSRADGERQRLRELEQRLQARLSAAGVQVTPGRHGPIFPIVVGDEISALEAAAVAASLGVRCHAVRPPTVPHGTARLRVTLHAALSPEEIDRLAGALVIAITRGETVDVKRAAHAPRSALAGAASPASRGAEGQRLSVRAASEPSSPEGSARESPEDASRQRLAGATGVVQVEGQGNGFMNPSNFASAKRRGPGERLGAPENLRGQARERPAPNGTSEERAGPGLEGTPANPRAAGAEGERGLATTSEPGACVGPSPERFGAGSASSGPRPARGARVWGDVVTAEVARADERPDAAGAPSGERRAPLSANDEPRDGRGAAGAEGAMGPRWPMSAERDGGTEERGLRPAGHHGAEMRPSSEGRMAETSRRPSMAADADSETAPAPETSVGAKPPGAGELRVEASVELPVGTGRAGPALHDGQWERSGGRQAPGGAATRWVVLGTGTGVGKTYVAAALVTAIGSQGRAVAGIKPVETGVGPGGPEDAQALARASFHVKHPHPHPLYSFTEPLTPARAARRANETIRLRSILAWIETTAARAGGAPDLVVETAGGLFSPLADALTNFELAQALGPSQWLLVAPDRLGVLHEVGSCLRALASLRRLPDHIVLSAPADPDASTGTNAEELSRITRIPILTIPRDDPRPLVTLLRAEPATV